MDDFLIAFRLRSKRIKARHKSGKLMKDCELQRKVGKGCWECAHRIEHFCFFIDTKKLRFGITNARLDNLASISQ